MRVDAGGRQGSLMDDLDKSILTILQRDFPLEKHPFDVVGERLGITGDEVRRRAARMKKEGLIRRIGGVFDREALGWSGTLCAARVPEDRLDDFVSAVNALPGVTHNYRRNHEYNVWFTLLAPSREEIDAILDSIRRQTGVDDIVDMRAVRTFKINATFNL